jgi:peptidoglycan/xylan/chitin deacetylase (PgdA/CDA1 family)
LNLPNPEIINWWEEIMFKALESNKELWDMYTKKEEYAPKLLDKFQRFPYYSSKYRNILEPVVSKFLVENGLKVEYSDRKKFAVCLSHDIDLIYSPILKIAHEIKFSLPKLHIKINPLWNFQQIMELEGKYKAKSTFFFLALAKGDLDFNYRISDLENWLGKIVDRGWEVGLHGGNKAYNSLDVIKKQKERLEKVIGKKVIGYRNHLMRFEVPTTWELLKEAGFKYDSTYGYNDCVGFRNGMCHPFKPYNLNTNQYIDVLELPLNIMDSTFDYYMRLNKKNEWQITQQLIDTIEELNGVITVLWHNTNMSGERLELYERILKYCHQKGAWMTSGEEIIKWWEKNYL